MVVSTVVSTSSPCVSDGADFLVQQTWQLLNVRSDLLKSLLKSYWVWQIPGLSKWVVRLAWQQVGSKRNGHCCNCDDFRATIELARQFIEYRETLRPLLVDQPQLCALLDEIDRNSWVRVEVVSYYADRLRDLERQTRVSTFFDSTCEPPRDR
jgi:hypothetical protein